ncbi:MAG TPA: PQQ-binding-like beta-propeller repeat protein [Polyangiales bacterium]|nr:PQQ-binding-like beta-propeller repeat protein [Polyangiales bacterium]
MLARAISLPFVMLIVAACGGGAKETVHPSDRTDEDAGARAERETSAVGAGAAGGTARPAAANSGGRQAREGGDVTEPARPDSKQGESPAKPNDDEDAGVPGDRKPDTQAAPRARWTNYGFDAKNSQVNPDERTLDATSVTRLKESWRLHMPDGATSTPAVVDGVAYFGGWNGNVYAVDATSGEIRWQRRVTAQQANSTPLVMGDRLYVSAGASLLALARSNGSVQWEKLLDTHPSAMIWSSPKLVDDMLILGVASFENGITFEPTFTGSVVAVEVSNGEEIWRIKTTGDGHDSFGRCVGAAGASVWSTAAIDEQLGLAYIGTGQGFDYPASTCSDSLLAFDYRRGHSGDRVRWLVQYSSGDVFGAVNLATGPDADIGAAPNLFEANGRALVGAGDKGGSYRAFDRKTGEAVWRANLEIGPYVQFGGVTTTAAVHGDTIYVASNHLEKMQWVIDGTHDPADYSNLYALDTATGAERWKLKLDAGMAGSFAIANGILYHSIVNRTLYARDLKDGKALWSAKLGNDPGSGPSVVDGRVFVSAGMALTAVLPTEIGGFVSSFALDAGPVMVREARKDVLEPFTREACEAKLNKERGSATCAACLCECDATAAGHCGSCSTLADCTASWCASAAAGAEMKECLANFCNAKLLPSFVFDQAVELAPCSIRCAASCGG